MPLMLRLLTNRCGWLSRLVLAWLAMASVGSAQFSQPGFFNDLMNQAIPRMNPTVPEMASTAIQAICRQVGLSTLPNNTFANATVSPSLVPGSIGRARDWRLGVGVDSLETGALVRNVTPGGAAQRAGLEQGDLIVAISGYQVGYVEGRLNDVGEQIRRTADINGRVRALVLDARTGQLQNLDVQLDSASTGVSGSVITRDRNNLPYGSILTVKLIKHHSPLLRGAGGQTISQVYGSGPFPFEIHYDPRYIDPSNQYQLTATITTSTGQLIYTLPQPISMNQQGLPPNLQLILEPAGNVIQASYSGDPGQLNAVFQQTARSFAFGEGTDCLVIISCTRKLHLRFASKNLG